MKPEPSAEALAMKEKALKGISNPELLRHADHEEEHEEAGEEEELKEAIDEEDLEEEAVDAREL
jgi:hypothetical protein